MRHTADSSPSRAGLGWREEDHARARPDGRRSLPAVRRRPGRPAPAPGPARAPGRPAGDHLRRRGGRHRARPPPGARRAPWSGVRRGPPAGARRAAHPRPRVRGRRRRRAERPRRRRAHAGAGGHRSRHADLRRRQPVSQTAVDQWIPSACGLCYGTCSIRGRVTDGVLVKIEGNPDSTIGRGRLCGKGVSGIMTLYDPNRLDAPLRRTNPEKGIGVDPCWKEISWEEALEEIVARLRKIHAEDPRKLFIQRTTTNTSLRAPFAAFAAAFGTPNSWAAGGGLHCGNGAHLIGGIMHAPWSLVPDFQHCRYAIYFGASKGHGAGHVACTNMQQAADARARGMRLVVVDPMCNFASAKASEWVPLRPGTPAALALALG